MSASCWQQIDTLRAKYTAEFKQTADALEGLRAIKNSLTTDDYGLWRCRYIPKGERRQETLTSHTGGGLVEKLKAIRAVEDEKAAKRA